MAGTEFRHAQRQVTIAFQALLKDLHVSRTVHRLQGEDAFLGFRRVHVLLKGFPMARHFPEFAVEQLRRMHFFIARIIQPLTHVILKQAVERPSFVVPKWHTSGLFLEMKQVHLPAQPAVVTFFRFFQTVQIDT